MGTSSPSPKGSQPTSFGPCMLLPKKERKSIAPFCTKVHTKRSGMDHMFYLQITPCLPFLRERSLDGNTTTTEAADIQLQLLLLIYRPRKDERLSWPGWLTYNGWFTHIGGHPSATGRAQDSESTPAKDRRYTAGPRNQTVRWIKNQDASWQGGRRRYRRYC